MTRFLTRLYSYFVCVDGAIKKIMDFIRTVSFFIFQFLSRVQHFFGGLFVLIFFYSFHLCSTQNFNLFPRPLPSDAQENSRFTNASLGKTMSISIESNRNFFLSLPSNSGYLTTCCKTNCLYLHMTLCYTT